MKKSAYIDYNSNVKITFEIKEGKYETFYTCQIEAPLKHRLEKNLKKITRIIKVNKSIYHIYLNSMLFIRVNLNKNSYDLLFKLTTYEVRRLTQGIHPKLPFPRTIGTKYNPVTDVHTHFTGAFTPDSLIKVGKKNNIEFEKQVLKKIGIDTRKYEGKKVSIHSLEKKDIDIIKKASVLSPITQETFNNLEDAYFVRGLFTKDKRLFKDLLRELVYSYKKLGIRYVEISYASIIEPYYLEACKEILPRLEKVTGVKVRFLASIWRFSSARYRREYVTKLLDLVDEKYIVGCDFMGKESNSTRVFSWEIETLVEKTLEANIDFTIRVHAGENPMYKNNVKDALKIVLKTYNKCKDKTSIKPKIRIGHGVYNCDEETIKLFKKLDAIVEFNISSNFALNNIERIKDIPIKRYIRRGIKVVLGSDGYGLTLTDPYQEVILSSFAGLTTNDFNRIRLTERELMLYSLKRDIKMETIEDYKNTDNLIRNDQMEVSYSNSNAEILQKLHSKMDDSHAITDAKEIRKAIYKKIPIAIIGSTYRNWLKTPIDQKGRIVSVIKSLIRDIDYDKVYIVTCGVNYGVEEEVHNICKDANYYNKSSMLTVLGLIPYEVGINSNEKISNGSLTHLSLMRNNYTNVRTWEEIPVPLVDYIKRHNGILICIGGGLIMSDIIQIAYNKGAYLLLMQNVKGTSSKEGITFDKKYKFKDYKELKTRLLNINENIFYRN